MGHKIRVVKEDGEIEREIAWGSSCVWDVVVVEENWGIRESGERGGSESGRDGREVVMGKKLLNYYHLTFLN